MWENVTGSQASQTQLLHSTTSILKKIRAIRQPQLFPLYFCSINPMNGEVWQIKVCPFFAFCFKVNLMSHPSSAPIYTRAGNATIGHFARFYPAQPPTQ